MHGRVKVLRTEEQERLRLEKKKRLENEFRIASDAVFAARQQNISNDVLMKLVPLIESVPYMINFWNHRRDILLSLLSSEDLTEEKRNILLNSELELTSRCISSSPKCYPVWHHRMWVMMHYKQPNWNLEIEFCNTALKSDERNFHCWDYRRFVVSYGSIDSGSELAFSRDFIENNLSNYSAWHYRKELLDSSVGARNLSPLYPPPHDIRNFDPFRLSSSLATSELDLVHNAIFTDTNDQSPWLYYWQILGHGLRKAYLRDLYVCRSMGRLFLVFTGAQPRSSLDHLAVTINVTVKDTESSNVFPLSVDGLGGWKCDLPGDVSSVWWLPITSDTVCQHRLDTETNFFYPDDLRFDISVCIRSSDNYKASKLCKSPNCPKDHLFCLHCTIDFHQNESLTRVDLSPLRLLNDIISPIHEPHDLLSEVDNLRELAHVEPRNKWILLTLISLLRFVDGENAQQEISDAIKTLSCVDPQRKGYYDYMKAAHAEQDALVEAYYNHSREVNLNNLGIRHLRYTDWYALMMKIDLSGNHLRELPDTIAYFVCVVDFNLDKNCLTNLSGISRLPSLTHLSVRQNRLSTFESITELLRCMSLQTVALHGNQVTELQDFTSFISKQANAKYKSTSFNVTYDKSIPQ